MLLVVFVLFVTCWTPMQVLILIDAYGGAEHSKGVNNHKSLNNKL